jgi:betaine-aldehyde dehydrogenase
VADAASGADCLEYFGGMAATLTGETVELGGDFAYTIREPLGVCVAIGAWNYPIQIACWKAAPALACGNAMVFKPSEETPLSALKLAEILVEAGAPPGVFNVIQGAARSARRWSRPARGQGLAHRDRCPRAQGLCRRRRGSETRDDGTGRQVAPDRLRRREMSRMRFRPRSTRISTRPGRSVPTGRGSSCKTGSATHSSTALTERTKNAVIGDPMDEATHIGPMVSERQRDIVLGFIAKGEAEGARLVQGGKARPVPAGSWSPRSSPTSPTT